jgi:hypothetical protein
MSNIKDWKEADLFTWLKDTTYPDLEKEKSRYSRHDCVSKDKEQYIELKCRRAHYDTLLIEKKKYDSILNKATENNSEAIYICSTPEGVWKFDIRNIKLTWETNYLNPATTYFAHGGRVAKEVSYIPLEFGKKLM